jgi:V/A-type H+-transporting ATPase subunit K
MLENINYMSQFGPSLCLGLGAVGSCFGCYIAGASAAAAMSRVEEGHAKMAALAAAPSIQCMYGCILALVMNQHIRSGDLSYISSIYIGIIAGTAFITSALLQGKVAAAGIQATMARPAVYGLTWVAVSVLEMFALFAFVFSFLII